MMGQTEWTKAAVETREARTKILSAIRQPGSLAGLVMLLLNSKQ
jgi:hypothetical protein